jgi:hypothetical protein
MISFIARTIRRTCRPISRPAALFLLVSHRRTIALWLRSVQAEFDFGRKAGRQDSERWKRLFTSLWTVSKTSTLVKENELRKLVVGENEVLADIGEPWPDRSEFRRAGVEPISFAEAAGQTAG